MYYKLAFRSRSKTPVILLGCIAVVMLLIGGVITAGGNKGGIARPDSKSSIVRFDIAGVTDSSISLFWRTDKPVIPRVSYSKDKNGQFTDIQDARDTRKSQTERHNHLITLSSLTSATVYYFKIDNVVSVSGDQKPLIFEVKTAPRIDAGSTAPIYGKLVNSAGKSLDDAIVLAKLENAYPLVTLSKNDGTFLLSTCCVIDAETFTSRMLDPEDPITTEIIDEAGNFLVIKDSYGHVSPFAQHLVISGGSKTIDNSVAKKPLIKNDPLVLGAVSKSAQNADIFSVIYPAQLAQIAYGNPLLKGTGVKGRSVKIFIDKTSFATSTQVDESGVWRAQFKGKLPVGQHELTVQSMDKLGNQVSIVRSFYVAKSGEQVLGEATGSATITPTLTPIVTDTPLPTPTTTILTPIPTTSYVTSVPAPPVTGMDISTSSFLIVSTALIVLGLGVILIF